ncbi:hypothetical protein DH2020_006128 [Rehmannia glutinosa]|uniref:Uncharacterized protein n=1 Tax=Rehmannia glutinosa TaxID=99300 RepID=A0ABR0XI82_REHGL
MTTDRWTQMQNGGQEIGTADHASTSTFRGETHASDAATRGPATEVITGVSVEEAARPSGSPARMSGPVTGIALLAIAVPTTSPAAQAASSAVPSRMTLVALAAALIARFHVLVALDLAAVAVAAAAAARDGNPVTGFVPDWAAMSTTLPAGWSASGAMHQGNSVANLHFNASRFSIFGSTNQSRRRENHDLNTPKEADECLFASS